MNKVDFLYLNIQPAIAIKLACEELGAKVIIEDGVIVGLEKEN